MVEVEILHNRIQGGEIENMDEGGSWFMLWVCMLGGVASVGRGEMYDWWVEITRRVVGEMGWEEVRSVLRGFAWVEYLCEPVCLVFWEQCFGGDKMGVVEVEEEGEVTGKGKEAVR